MGALSPFRTGFLKVALFISGSWTDVPMNELGDDGVTIVRGRSDESGRAEPSRLSFRVKDPTGKYSPRHPGSAFFGLIGRGTKVRVQVEMTTGVVVDRFFGEVTTWTPRWSKTGSKDSYVEVEAAGVLRRIGQGSSPLRSVLYRSLSGLGTNLIGYWPMEDGTDSTQFASFNGVAKPLAVSGTPTFATYGGFAASDSLPTLQSAKFVATVPGYTPLSPAKAQVRWVTFIPSATPDQTILLRVKCSGTLDYVEIRYESANSIFINGVKEDGTSAGSASGWLTGSINNRKLRMSLEMTQSGADISVTVSRYEVGAANAAFTTGTFSAVTLGRVTSVEFNPLQTANGDLAVGHVTVEKDVTGLFDVSASALGGYNDELATDRLNRLCVEHGLTFAYFSTFPSTTRMGPQKSKELPELLQEAVDSDGGILYEPRAESQDLVLRSLNSIYSQTPVTIAYVDNMVNPFEPVEDDQGTRNTVSVTREGGSSYTVTEATGALGTDAVGIYDEAVTLSLSKDVQALQQAGWRLHIGTFDEARWPTLGFDLADPRILANTTLRDNILALSLGSRLDITGVPSWLPPFPVSQIVQGYTEVITPTSYKLVFNCTPARPYRAAFWDATTDRYSGEGTTLSALLNTTDTSFTVVPVAGTAWTHADGDYDILVNGERMTVTNVVGNVFTVTRSVNGVVKSHALGSAIELYDPCYYGL